VAVLAAVLAGGLACNDGTPAVGGSTPGPDALAGDGGAPTGDGSTDAPGAASTMTIDCFMGTPRTNEEFLNACWPDEVVAIVKAPKLPGGYKVGMPLPAPPP
jgi:hypothetical protein